MINPNSNDMKIKSLLIGTLLAGIASTSIAQNSISLHTFDPGTYLNAEVEIAPPIQQDLPFHAYVTNIGNASIDLRVSRETVSSASGQTNNFCIGPACYPDFVDTSNVNDIVPMAPGAEETSFIAHMLPHETVGVSVVKYCFWDNNNMADSACVTVTYDILPVGVDESSDLAAEIGNVYPNPVNGTANFAYVVEGNPQVKEVLVYDLLGNVVSQSTLDGFQGVHNYDTSNLSTGLYFVTVQLDGTPVSTKKFTVSR
jgi:hypothetical protein